jgi:hypothetical protein
MNVNNVCYRWGSFTNTLKKRNTNKFIVISGLCSILCETPSDSVVDDSSADWMAPLLPISLNFTVWSKKAEGNTAAVNHSYPQTLALLITPGLIVVKDEEKWIHDKDFLFHVFILRSSWLFDQKAGEEIFFKVLHWFNSKTINSKCIILKQFHGIENIFIYLSLLE